MGFYVVEPVERDGSKEYTYEQVWQELVLDKTYLLFTICLIILAIIDVIANNGSGV